MNTLGLQVERRVGQRFSYFLPVTHRELTAGAAEGLGMTQDLSARGVFFLTDASLREGSEIELTLKMPSEITLGPSMRVRCRGRVLRVVRPSDQSGAEPSNPIQRPAKIGVAVRLECYEYLTEPAEPASLARVATLHPHDDGEKPLASGRS